MTSIDLTATQEQNMSTALETIASLAHNLPRSATADQIDTIARAALASTRVSDDGPRLAVAKLLDPIAPAQVAVKALEWATDAYGDLSAYSPVGTYSCPKFHSQWDFMRDGHHMHPKVHGVIKAYPTLEAAKAAAQADYETRIRSALAEGQATEGMVLVPREPTVGEWIEWEGGECPVDAEAVVDIRCKSFDVVRGIGVRHHEMHDQQAGEQRWSGKGWKSDIIAFRVVSAPAVQS